MDLSLSLHSRFEVPEHQSQLSSSTASPPPTSLGGCPSLLGVEMARQMDVDEAHVTSYLEEDDYTSCTIFTLGCNYLDVDGGHEPEDGRVLTAARD